MKVSKSRMVLAAVIVAGVLLASIAARNDASIQGDRRNEAARKQALALLEDWKRNGHPMFSGLIPTLERIGEPAIPALVAAVQEAGDVSGHLSIAPLRPDPTREHSPQELRVIELEDLRYFIREASAALGRMRKAKYCTRDHGRGPHHAMDIAFSNHSSTPVQFRLLDESRDVALEFPSSDAHQGFQYNNRLTIGHNYIGEVEFTEHNITYYKTIDTYTCGKQDTSVRFFYPRPYWHEGEQNPVVSRN